MDIRQSHLQQWNRCPESYRLKYVEGLQGRQSAAASYGTVLHYALQTYWLNDRDLELTKRTFEYYWNHPDYLDCNPDYYLPRTSWSFYLSHGRGALDHYHEAQTTWSAGDQIVGVEVPFRVPVGSGHTLTGTMDLLRITDKGVLDVADYKTGKTSPFLRYNVQFTAYVYATYQDEFWRDLPNGEEWQQKVADLPRTATWIDLKSTPFKEVSAGSRVAADFHRLGKTCDALASSVEAEIFVPTLSGESCSYCDFYDECGLPEGNLLTARKADEISYDKNHFEW